MNDNRPWLGLVFVVLSATSYAANSTSSVVAYSGGATPLSMVSFRVTFTVIALYALLRLTSVSLVMVRRDRNISLALGFLLAVYSYCLMEAFDRLPVALTLARCSAFSSSGRSLFLPLSTSVNVSIRTASRLAA